MVFKIDTLFCELTNRCNSNCIMCTHQFMKRKEEDMKVSMIESILKQVKPKTIIYHFFGESLLYEHLGYAINLANQKNIYTVIDTNAQLLTPSMFTYLSACGLGKVIISFGASTKKTYESIWRNLDFDTVINNIQDIYKIKKRSKLKTRIEIRIIVTKENRKEVISCDPSFIDFIEEFSDRFTFVKEFHLFGYDRVPFKKRRVKDCKQRDRLNKEMVIKSNGDIILCCADLDGEYVIGNIQEDTIKNIYYGDKFNEYRDRVYRYGNPPDICVECGVRPW